MARAVAGIKSICFPRTNGPRSLTRTATHPANRHARAEGQLTVSCRHCCTTRAFSVGSATATKSIRTAVGGGHFDLRETTECKTNKKCYRRQQSPSAPIFTRTRLTPLLDPTRELLSGDIDESVKARLYSPIVETIADTHSARSSAA